jgi:YidC/Oxa1 family membrane protein insertase
MENQRLILAIGVFFTGFLLWQEWQLKDVKLTATTPVTQSNVIKNINDDGLPNTTTIANQKSNQDDLPQAFGVIEKTNIKKANGAKTTAKDEFITVKTDVLTVEISTRGGTIQKVILNNFAVSLKDQKNKVTLLSNEISKIYKVQSGLLSPKKLPTHNSIFIAQKSVYDLEGNNELTVPLTWKNEEGIEVTKIFHFKRDSYLIDVNYKINNQSDETINAQSYLRIAREKPLEKSGAMGMNIFTGGAFNNAEKYQMIDFDEFKDGNNLKTQGGWMAMAQHYFLVSVLPNEKKIQTFTSDVYNGLYRLSMVNSVDVIKPKTTFSTDINQLFIGPKEQVRLNNISDDLDRTVDYGILYVIAKPLAWVMHQIYEFVQSWGWTIILLTILIKLVFYKLSEKSYRSMAGMRKLTPKMKRIKELYGDDRQKVSQKMMALYKEEKINPAAGCLPILVQIPVFMALYWVLLDSVELRQTTFWWLADLSAKDPYYILPIIMGASMFIQQKLNPQPSDPMQAKIMAFLPLIFTVMFLWFPSGLVLYWVVNNILSIAQQWMITKRLNA